MNWKLINLIPIAALAFQGCGGDADALNAASGQVSSAQSLAAVSTVSGSLDKIKISFVAPAMNAPAGGGPGAASVYDGCTTVGPNPRVDADGDGIALSKVYTYNCNNLVDSGNTYNLVGSESFIDKDDTKSIQLGGYSTAFDYLWDNKAPNGRVEGGTYKGSFDLTPSATKVTYAHTYSIDFHETGSTTGSANYKQRNIWSSVYSPTDMANPSNGGTLEISGYYALNGTNTNHAGWGTMDVTFEVSSSDLTYQTGCIYYKSGTISFVDGSSNRYTWEYACTGVTIRFNGAQVASLP